MTAWSDARARRRGAIVALPLLLAGLLAPVAFAAPASAAVLSNGITTIKTGFAINGNKTVTNNTPDTFDWDDFLVVDDLTNVGSEGLFEFIPTGPYVTTDGNQSTGIIDATFAWDNGTLEEECSKPDDTGFPGSQKPDDNPWVSGYVPSVTGKANGCSFGSAHEIVTVGSVEHHILYQYWTRLVDVGDMTTYQTLEGGDAGRCDDYVVEFNYDPSDGTSVRVLEWVPTVSGDCAVGAEGAWSAVAPNFPYQAAVGTRVEGADLPAAGQTFGEVAVDLTAAGLFDEDSCTAFKTSGYVTRTGNKVNAELGDMVGGADPLTISNCGAITISKAALPSTATSAATFGYLIDRTNTGPAHEASLAGVSGATPLTDTTPGDNTQIGSALAIGAKHTWTGVFAGTYALSEDAIPGNVPWALASMECKVKSPTTGQIVTFNTLTNGVLAGIPVYTSATTDCVITNTTSYVVIEKVATGGSGTFGFDLNNVNGPLTPEATIDTSSATATAPIAYAPGAQVTITELLDVVNGVANDDIDWKLDDITCSNGAKGADGEVTVTTVAGATITCVFTNSRLGKIVINKVVEGTTKDATFNFGGSWTSGTPAIVDGAFNIPTAIVDGSIVGSQTFLNVEPDSYDLSEFAKAGFDAKNLVCLDPDKGTVVDLVELEAEIDLDAGETVSCTYTNTERGMILVDKETLPGEHDQDFTFGFTPPGESTVGFVLNDSTDDELVPWSSGLVKPGVYTVAETVPANWSLTSISCGTPVDASTIVTLEPGAVITCVFTNTADPGALTLTKSVEGVDPAFAWEFDIDLIASDDSVVTETVDNSDPVAEWTDLPVGETYTLIEGDLPDGWTADEVVCTGLDDADDSEDGFQFVVTPGLDLECTLLNTADPAGVELEKTVSGVGDDVTWSFEFTLNPAPGSGPAKQSANDGDATISWPDLTPGVTYTISETDVAGWTEGAVACEVEGSELDDADPGTAGFQFVAAPGLALGCEVDNVAVPASIEITKTTIGGDGTFEFVLQPLPSGTPVVASVETSAGEGTAEFENLEPGSRFSLAESNPVGGEWDPGTLVCTVTAAGSQTSLPLNVADFTVAAGDAIACAITNTATGTIIIVKNVVGANGTFKFSGDWLTPETFEITTTGDPGTGTKTFDDLLEGPYTVSEIVGDGYDGIKLECDDDGDEIVGLTATLDLDPGETIICVYTNSEWGVLVVDKVTLFESSEEFDFEWSPAGDGEGEFSLADTSDAFSTGTIPPGDYEVSELVPGGGWVLTDLECTDPAGDDTDPVVDGETATVHVALGENVRCTFTNAKRGPLKFDKVVAPGFPVQNGDGTWTIEYDLTVTSESQIAENYDLTDELDFGDGIVIVPTSASVVSNDGVTVNAGWDGVGGASDILVADNATIPALGTHTYTVTVTAELDDEIDPDAADCSVADGEGTGFLNAGTVAFGNGTADDDACASLPVSDLEITKDAPFGVDFEPAEGPTGFEYKIVVKNLGPATAKQVVLEDALPAGLEFVSVTASAGTCGFAAGVVTCQFGDLAVGATRTVTIKVSIPVDYPLVDGKTSFTIPNVASTSTVTPESDLTNNEDGAETTVLVTLPLPPEDPELPTLALTGAAIGFATQFGLGLLAVGVALAVASLRRRRTGGRHAA